MHRPIRMPAGAVDNATGTIMVVGIVDKITFLLKLRTSPAPLEIEARCRQRVGAVASQRCQKTHCFRNECKPQRIKGLSRHRLPAYPTPDTRRRGCQSHWRSIMLVGLVDNMTCLFKPLALSCSWP